MTEWHGPSADLRWKPPPTTPDTEPWSDRRRWEWEMTTAKEVKGQRAGIPLPPHETRTIKGTAAHRDGQLARRFVYAGYELLEVEERGTGWNGKRAWDLHFRRKGKRGWEYEFYIEGIDVLEALTAHTPKLRYWLWQETKYAQERHEKHQDHYRRREDLALERLSKAIAGLVAYRLEIRYAVNGYTERYKHRADLTAARAELRERIAERVACEATIAKRVGKEPPYPVEGLVIGRIQYVRPRVA